MLQEFWAVPSMWSQTSLGAINIGISFTPFQLVYSLLSYAGLGYGLSERLVFLWPILIAFPLGSYLLIKKNINNTLAAVIGSFVYCYNSYFSLIKTGHLTLLAAFAFIPFVFLFYQKALEDKKVFYVLLTALFGFIVSFYEFRAFYLLCFLLFFYAIFYAIFLEKKYTFKSFIKLGFFAVIPLIIIFLLNAYWLIAIGKTGTLVSNAYFDRNLFGNEFLNILSALSFHHPFWTGTKTAVFEVQPIPLYFWLIPFLAFLGLYVNRTNKYILFFGGVAVLGIFLTKQVGIPYTDIYPWLFGHFPGFNAFREASKFYFFIAIGYSVLIAGFCDWLLRHWKTRGFSRYIKCFLIVFIACLFLWNLKPIMTTEIRTLFITRQMPEDYNNFKKFILSQNTYFRTLWIPTYSRWSMYNNSHPQISAVMAINSEWNTYIQDKRTDKITEPELLAQLLNLPYANQLLDASSVKYVVIPLEDKQNEDNFFTDYQKPRQYYISLLDKLSYLKKTNLGTKNILVYENKEVNDHIYLSSERDSLKKKGNYQKVSFQAISPTEYLVDLKNIRKPVYLHFSENYHPGWKVQIASDKWLSDDKHFQTDAGLNVFLIEPQDVCVGNSSCTIVLTFKPQTYVYIGSVISVVTFIILLIGLIYFFIKKKNAK